jgi:hypothetical protein
MRSEERAEAIIIEDGSDATGSSEEHIWRS